MPRSASATTRRPTSARTRSATALPSRISPMRSGNGHLYMAFRLCKAAGCGYDERVRIGVPKEIKTDENRVALTPSGVAALRAHDHEVLVERGAGCGSSIDDAAYEAAGAGLVDADEAWSA